VGGHQNMTGKVVDILEHMPHVSGKASCLGCGHWWVAVAPTGTVCLQCPECGLDKGVFHAVCVPDTYWTCTCGCAHFFVSGTTNIICALCGEAQVF